MQAMIFCAGLGTRMKHLTQHQPKPLIKVNGKALLQRNIEYLKEYGVKDFVINVFYLKNQIIDFIDDYQQKHPDCFFQIVDETPQILDTGGGLKNASALLKSNHFITINSDILTNVPLNNVITHHQQTNALITLAVSQRKSDRVLLFNDKQLIGWKNKKTNETKMIFNTNDYTEFAFSGISIYQHQALTLITQHNVFSLIDVFLDLGKTHLINYYNHSHEAWFFDVGSPEKLTQVEAFLK